MFDHTNKKDIKIISDNVLPDTNIDQNEVLFEDLSEELPSKNTKISFNHYRLKRNECLEMAAKTIKIISEAKSNKSSNIK